MTEQRKKISPLERWMRKMPFFISCEEVESFILAYLEDELPLKTKILFRFHLSMCKECQRYLASYRRTISISRAVVDAEDLPPLPEDLVKAIIKSKN